MKASLFVALLSITWASAALSKPVTYPHLVKLDFMIDLVKGRSSVERQFEESRFLQKRLEAIATVKVEQFDSLQIFTYSKKAEQIINADVVVKELEGCKEFDEKCQRLLKFLNREKPWNEKGFEGYIAVPAKTFGIAYSVCALDASHEAKIEEIFSSDPSWRLLSRSTAMYIDGSVIWEDDLSCTP